MQKKKY